MNTYYLAVDLGASGVRHILGHLEDGKLMLEEIHRFENGPVRRNGRLCWDTDVIFTEILTGLKKCGDAGKIPVSLGIDTWGVDFVLLDRAGNRLGDAIAYRDARTAGMDAEVEKYISDEELYTRTGTGKQIYNTVYQLTALKHTSPELLADAAHLLMMPDYFRHLLTGEIRCESTVASTSGLISAGMRDWDRELIALLGFDGEIFSPVSAPGTAVAELRPAVQKVVGFNCTVSLPASHDTASAYMAVPAQGSGNIYLSSGTWSLLGTEPDSPVITEAARAAGFTNEGGYGGGIRFLRNIMGLWMIQSVRRELGKRYSFDGLAKLADETSFKSIVDVSDDRFLAPGSMTETIREACRQSGQPVPETPGELAATVYHSLASCYADSIRAMERITGTPYQRIHIVGGGCQNRFLNQLTAAYTGLPVEAGPVEATAAGNLGAQLLAAGEIADLAAFRDLIRQSFPTRIYQP